MSPAELQRAFWLALRDLGADRHPHAPFIVDRMLEAADMYAATREVAFHSALAAADTPGNTAMRREELEFATRPRKTA